MWHDEYSKEERIPIIQSGPTEREFVAFWLASLAVLTGVNTIITVILMYLALQ